MLPPSRGPKNLESAGDTNLGFFFFVFLFGTGDQPQDLVLGRQAGEPLT